MKGYQKIINLINEYLSKKGDVDESDAFCNAYMDMYFDLSDELNAELSTQQFEALDELNLVCDSYEKNPRIREVDKYSIDEQQLREKILFYLNFIKK